MITQDQLETLNAVNLAANSPSLKAVELRNNGWAKDAISVIRCMKSDGSPHVVLGVNVDGDVWILDSLIPVVYPKPVMPYQSV